VSFMARKPPSADIQSMMNQLLQTGTTGGGRGRRSPLFRWMYSRADDLKKMLDDVQPSWDAVAAVLPATDDVRDGSGKRPNGERVRKTWFEVRLAKGWDAPRHTQARKSAQGSAAPVRQIGATPPTPQPVGTFPSDDPDDDRPPPKHNWTPTTKLK
jgi:hypothetical protein